MNDDFDPRELMQNQLPTVDEVELLPDTHPLLSTRIPIFDFENDQRSTSGICELLITAMDRFNGAGIAANQIGLEIRAFAMRRFKTTMVLFNPVIAELSPETVMMEEGCLTFPNLRLNIARPASCRINYSDADGNRCSDMLTGFEAKVAMHEIDHLNGVVMTSKVSKLKLDMAKKRAKKHTGA